MLNRCDLSTIRECSCEPSGVPCRVQQPLDLGTFRGTNNPGPLDSYPTMARDLSFALIAAAVIAVTAFHLAEKSFERVDRAYQTAGRV